LPHQHDSDDLAELSRFGTNPGALRGWLHLPDILARNTPLVVVLHGCTQTAADYDRGAGWTTLARRKGFAVLFPEQQRANNANGCFNWFESGDTRRDAGEAKSISEMVAHVVKVHGLDANRVFITGLSAGGAMANVMLATYPEQFAAGAIIGGLPYGTATGVAQAFERMHGRNAPNTEQLQSAVKSASAHTGPWPKLSVWHGTHDHIVKPVNAEQIIEQWHELHGTAASNPSQSTVNGHVKKVWLDNTGKAAIELYLVKGMAHGVPLADGLGQPGPFMLNAGLSSTARIAQSWGLADDADVKAAENAAEPTATNEATAPLDVEAVLAKAMSYIKPKRSGKDPATLSKTQEGVGKVITDALRAAGLMR
jgi:poly(hydroxyalkanoate) depolymerase family esterase